MATIVKYYDKVKVIIHEPDITREENERRLEKVKEVMLKISYHIARQNREKEEKRLLEELEKIKNEDNEER